MTERKHSLWAGVAIATTLVGIGLTALSVSNAGFLANTYDASRPAQSPNHKPYTPGVDRFL